MNFRSMIQFQCVALAAVILAGTSSDAQALNLSTALLDVRQVDFTSGIRLGHLVTGRTSMVSIVVGGTFRVTCPSSYTGVLEGYNWRAQTYTTPNVLTVEVPPGFLPAERVLPGFDNVPGGTSLQCSYNWTGAGKEATYQLSAYGLGMTIGGETTSQADTRIFEMYQPNGDGERDNTSCIH